MQNRPYGASIMLSKQQIKTAVSESLIEVLQSDKSPSDTTKRQEKNPIEFGVAVTSEDVQNLLQNACNKVKSKGQTK